MPNALGVSQVQVSYRQVWQRVVRIRLEHAQVLHVIVDTRLSRPLPPLITRFWIQPTHSLTTASKACGLLKLLVKMKTLARLYQRPMLTTQRKNVHEELLLLLPYPNLICLPLTYQALCQFILLWSGVSVASRCPTYTSKKITTLVRTHRMLA